MTGNRLLLSSYLWTSVHVLVYVFTLFHRNWNRFRGSIALRRVWVLARDGTASSRVSYITPPPVRESVTHSTAVVCVIGDVKLLWSSTEDEGARKRKSVADITSRQTKEQVLLTRDIAIPVRTGWPVTLLLRGEVVVMVPSLRRSLTCRTAFW